MILKITMISIAVFYSICNIVMAYNYNAKEMYGAIIEGQCTVGMIFANLFYLPAWLLKCLKMIIFYLVK